ncbi:DUF4097 family beta strand repeat-containing protein [Streptomyces sp. WZ-12]|uniref:DUF4097 family beta strand repeat-containing protein n=1 Tax=Streptomyces sp. WZ-12 TaxID=3030210 RepID=UPI002380E851|nr:DUF4097 family beta strand repeat-containing protein [Streptomyces sp. WZ-12]
MTERSYTSQTAGPVVLGVDLPTGSVRVQVDDAAKYATVALRTDDSSGKAVDALNKAHFGQVGQALTVQVPELPGTVMTQTARGSQVVQSFGTVYGTVTGMTIVNGQIITGGTTLETVSPTEAVVTLPPGSSLAVVTTSADTLISGYVEEMEFRSISGVLDADGVRRLTADTTSGYIAAGRITETANARSISGHIDLGLYDGHDARLDTTSGAITLHATKSASGTITARSVSGAIDITGGPNVHKDTHTVTGRLVSR